MGLDKIFEEIEELKRGRGTCSKCKKVVNNVTYHEAHECEAGESDGQMKFYRYRYTATAIGSFDYDSEYFNDYGYDDVKLELEEFLLVRETPKGYWIAPIWFGGFGHYPDEERWVSKTARKRHAYPTKKEALESFLARKTKQAKILKRQLTNVEKAIKLAEKL
jgi:hypothetical protein